MVILLYDGHFTNDVTDLYVHIYINVNHPIKWACIDTRRLDKVWRYGAKLSSGILSLFR